MLATEGKEGRCIWGRKQTDTDTADTSDTDTVVTEGKIVKGTWGEAGTGTLNKFRTQRSNSKF